MIYSAVNIKDTNTIRKGVINTSDAEEVAEELVHLEASTAILKRISNVEFFPIRKAFKRSLISPVYQFPGEIVNIPPFCQIDAISIGGVDATTRVRPVERNGLIVGLELLTSLNGYGNRTIEVTGLRGVRPSSTGITVANDATIVGNVLASATGRDEISNGSVIGVVFTDDPRLFTYYTGAADAQDDTLAVFPLGEVPPDGVTEIESVVRYDSEPDLQLAVTRLAQESSKKTGLNSEEEITISAFVYSLISDYNFRGL